MPEKYKNNKAIIIIKNNDQLCFLWCILACLYPVEDKKNRTSKFVIHMPTLCTEGLEFPMEVNDIPKFERLNKLNTGGQQCGINVYELTGTVLTPIHTNTN